MLVSRAERGTEDPSFAERPPELRLGGVDRVLDACVFMNSEHTVNRGVCLLSRNQLTWAGGRSRARSLDCSTSHSESTRFAPVPATQLNQTRRHSYGFTTPVAVGTAIGATLRSTGQGRNDLLFSRRGERPIKHVLPTRRSFTHRALAAVFTGCRLSPQSSSTHLSEDPKCFITRRST